MQKTLDEVKVDFVVTVYDQITRQIQHSDIKTSIIISWDSVIAVMLGREVANMIGQRSVNVLTVFFALVVLVTLAVSGVYIFGTLRPRARPARGSDFTGLLYTGDILRLGKDAGERMTRYLQVMVGIVSPAEIYTQFINSIVLISEIQKKKNSMFLRALASTAISFAFLVGLIAASGIIEAKIGV